MNERRKKGVARRLFSMLLVLVMAVTSLNLPQLAEPVYAATTRLIQVDAENSGDILVGDGDSFWSCSKKTEVDWINTFYAGDTIVFKTSYNKAAKSDQKKLVLWTGTEVNTYDLTNTSTMNFLYNTGKSYTTTVSGSRVKIGYNSTTLYLYYEAKCKVTYDLQGGSCQTNQTVVNRGNSVTLPAPTKAGYTFDGWYTAATGGTKKGNAGASFTPGEAATTLYAHWKHEHNWEYGTASVTSENDSITAYCTSESCPSGATEDQKLFLTLSAEDQQYSGAAYSGVSIEDHITAVTGTAVSEAVYYLADGMTKTDSANSGAAKEGAAPVNTGSYIAKVTLNGMTAEHAFQITKADAVANVNAVSGLVYNGKAQKLVTADVTGGTPYFRLGADGEWSTDIPAGVSAEDSPYTVYYYVEGDSNHNDYASEENPASVQAQIARKEFSDSDVQMEHEHVGYYYDKKEHTIDDIVLSGEAEGAVITYATEKDGVYTAEKPSFTNVKSAGEDRTYTVYYKISKPEYADKIGYATVTIEPKTLSVTWNHTEDLVYNGKEQKPVATADNLYEGDNCEIQVGGAAKDYRASDYEAEAIGVSNPNYALPDDDSVKTAFKINKKEIGIVWGHTEDLIYNGREQTPYAEATGLCEGDVCEVSVAGAKKDAGSGYTATATEVNNDNYKLPEDVTTSFIINPKALTADTVEVSMAGEGITGSFTDGYQFSWDGVVKTPVITVRDTETGEILSEDKEYSLSGTTSEEEIGGYRVILRGTGNYTDRVAMKWSIVKAVIHPQISIQGWTYGDTPATPQITGTQIQGDVTYTYYKDEDCTVPTTEEDGADKEGGVPKGAGTYWVKAAVAETDYYAPATAIESFTIEKRAVTVTPKAGQGKIYGDMEPEITYDASLIGDDTLSGSLSRIPGEDAGTYEITQGTLASANYDITVAAGVMFTVKQKTLTADMISLKQVNYAFTGKKIIPEYQYHDMTAEVTGTGITEADVEFSGQTYSSEYGVYKVNIKGQGNYTGRISKTWCISPVQDVNTDYDGNSHKIEVSDIQDVELKFADASGSYTLDQSEIPSYENPGEYIYKYQMVVDKGTDFEETAEGYAVLKINKVPLSGTTLEMPDEFVYGEEIHPSVKNAGDGEITYYYKEKDAEDSAYTTEKPEKAGDYTVKAVIRESAFYEDGEITKDFSITPGTLEEKNPDTVFIGKKDSGKQTVVLDDSYTSLDGVQYTVGDYSDPDMVIKNGSITIENGKLSYDLTGECDKDTAVTIPVTISSTNYKDIIIYVTIKLDATAPEGTIQVGQNIWQKFWNTISFNVFYKNTKDVTITGKDTSGDVDIWYYVANKEMSENEVKALSDEEWTKGNAFTISKKNTYVIYIKLSDKFGNTSYISSEGIVFYEDAQAETERIDYVRNSNADATAKTILNGNTIKEIKVGNEKLIPDEDYTVASDGTITFKAEYLQELSASDEPYTVIVSYNPAGMENASAEGNETPADTRMTLYVTRNEGSITQISDCSKEYDGTSVEAPAVVSSNAAQVGQITYAYKKAADPDDAYSETAPKDAGDYVVKVTVAQDDFYKTVSKTADFTISPKSITAAVTAENKIYDGSKAATVYAKADTGVEGEELVITGLSGTFTDANANTTKTVTVNSENAEVRAANDSTIASNYKVTYTTEAVASIEPKEIGITWGDKEFIYDGNAHLPAAKATGLVEGDTCGLTVKGELTDAGTGTAEVIASDNPNYKLPLDTKEKTTEFVIGCGDADFSVSAVTDKNYKDDTFYLEVSKKGDGKVSFVSSNENVATVDENGKVTITGAGAVTITASLEKSGNYNADSTSVTFTVKKINHTLTVIKTTYDVIYGDAPFQIAAAADDAETAVKFESSDESVAAVDENGMVTIKKAGTAVITVSMDESSNYTVVSRDIEINAAPKAVTVTAEDAVKHITKEDPEFTYTADGLVGNDSLSDITLSRKDGETAGTYEINVSQKAGANVNYDITFVPGTLTIEDHVWSEWKEVQAPTAEANGKKESSCMVCDHKRYESIPATAEPEDPSDGKLEKDVQVAPDAPIEEAMMTNSKSELLEAENIFTTDEKKQIESGAVNARVWMEINETDLTKIKETTKDAVYEQAESIMGDQVSDMMFFDADLFKEVTNASDGSTVVDKTQIHEPGGHIAVTVQIPEKLLSDPKKRSMVREYKIIRIHTDQSTNEDSIEVLDGHFNENSKEFSFETDKFSTYAIAFSDVPLTVSIEGNGSTKELTKKGETLELTAAITPDSAADRAVTWTSSNPAVATVDENGVVTAISNGTAQIMATVTDGGVTAECTVKVNIPETEKPETPEKPDIPAKPETPEKPDVPAKPETPVKPENPAKPDTSIAPTAKPADTQVNRTEPSGYSEKPQNRELISAKSVKAPRTGDSSNFEWVVLMLSAGVCLLLAERRQKRNKA